jgi:hypothetical protein
MVTRFACFLVVTICCIAKIDPISASQTSELERPRLQSDTWVYTFQADDNKLLSKPEPHKFPAGTFVEDVLDSLARHLANTYFLKIRDDTTHIRFDVVTVREIPAPGRPLRIAVIDMKDPAQFAMGYFFQGSSGGAVTFYMLEATFLQPQWDPPLLDGLMILYNGAWLKELDHINLHGLVAPRMVSLQVKRAIDTPWQGESRPLNED